MAFNQIPSLVDAPAGKNVRSALGADDEPQKQSPNPAHPKVLIAAARSLALEEAQALAPALDATGRVTAVILDGRLNELPVLPPNQKPAQSKPQSSWRSRLKALPALQAAALTARIKVIRSRADQLIRQFAPAAIVVFDDRHVIPDRVMIDAGRRAGIPAVLVPYAVSSLESDLFVRESDVAHVVDTGLLRSLKRRLAKKNPEQAVQSRHGKQLLFYKPLDMLVLQSAGLLPSHPWVYGGSGPDLVCAMGPDHAEYMTAGGVARRNIAITGQPSLDRLISDEHEQHRRRAALSEEYGFDQSRNIAICAVPQHAEHGMNDSLSHTKSTAELFAALSSSGFHVLLSLHPKSRREDYESLAAQAGLPILRQRLIEALPAADLLIAAFSTTIRWCIGLGRPAIALDTIESGYRLYSDLAGVRIARRISELAETMHDLASDEAAWNELKREARCGQTSIGAIDGRNAERAAQAILQTIVKTNNRRS